GSREILDFKDLSSPSAPAELVANAAFLEPAGHAAAHEPFNGQITLGET
nr:L-carnitine amidase {N-terminal} [bacteria, DSM 6230, Peptide Partial, 48 aa] [Bacteria]